MVHLKHHQYVGGDTHRVMSLKFTSYSLRTDEWHIIFLLDYNNW